MLHFTTYQLKAINGVSLIHLAVNGLHREYTAEIVSTIKQQKVRIYYIFVNVSAAVVYYGIRPYSNFQGGSTNTASRPLLTSSSDKVDFPRGLEVFQTPQEPHRTGLLHLDSAECIEIALSALGKDLLLPKGKRRVLKTSNDKSLCHYAINSRGMSLFETTNSGREEVETELCLNRGQRC